MVEKIGYVLLIVNIVALIVGVCITSKRRRLERVAAIKTRDLYQTILNETQTGVVAHDIKTGEIF